MPDLSTIAIQILAGVTALLITLGLIEYLVHRARLNAVPIRIHVNGTRGKSSVTRLIAAGLREGGVRTFAKTTGTVPRYILPSGRELPVYRAAGPNVIEQRRAVAMGVAHHAEALVLECMALQPRLQWLSQSKLIPATHGVITNARPDHLDVMGPNDEDVAFALAATTPVSGTLFTAESQHIGIFEASTADRRSELVQVHPSQDDASIKTLGGFSYHEHPDNVALALAVCGSLGVDRETALRGMWNAKPDPGAMTEHEVDFFGRRLVFVNGFAANDPVSTRQIWEGALNQFHDVDQRIALFNCRSDRADRSKQLAEAYMQWRQADEVVLMGTGQYLFARTAVRLGLDPTQLTFVESMQPGDAFEAVAGLVSSSALIMGMGNIAEPGLGLCEYFANRRTSRG